MTDELPIPPVNADSAPYWEAAAEGKLRMQRCDDCGEIRFPPGHICRKCGSEKATWIEVGGRGRVHSFTIMRRAPTPAYAARVPYVLALVDLDDGPRMMANIIGDGALKVSLEEPVDVTFEERGEGFKLPQFTRLGA